MLLSQKELKNYGIDLEINQLEKGLIQLGHEVEGYESFENEYLVVGRTITCEKHPEADKLNVVTVDIGTEVLQIVCGAPNIGVDQFVIVAKIGCTIGEIKIKKAKLRGVESNGMICSLAELGINDKALTEEDINGIYNFANDQELGINALVALGLEDNVLDVSLTANRGDCLSYVGIARDLSALKNQRYEYANNQFNSSIDNNITATIGDENSKILSTMLINNIEVTKTPEWLKIWLAKHEIKTQNNIVDIANYVMFSIGLPIHTYDADKVSGNLSSVVDDARFVGTEFVALDGNKYTIKEDSLVIIDNEKVISLASVMGSEATKITSTTKNILIEIGVFDPVLVRKTAAKLLNKKTDASIRGEKNVDHNQVNNAYNLLVELITNLLPDASVSNINQDNKEIETHNITLKLKDVKNILGITIENKRIVEILNNLHFNTINLDDEKIEVMIPSHRFDVANDHDLIEEVIRVHNIDNISVSSSMSSFISTEKIIKNKKVKIERFLEQVVLSLGLNQVITYSLVSSDELQQFGGNLDNAVELMMPLSNQHQYYRQSLVPSLMNVAKYNFDRQQKTSNIFEIANTYTFDNNEINEKYFLSGLVAGVKQNHYENGFVDYDFYDLKYVVESILTKIGIDFSIVKTTNEIQELNKYGHADIIVDNKVIGFIGAKHPNYYKKIKPNVYVFELDLTLLETYMNHEITYVKVSNNPIVERDITILAPIDTEYEIISSIFNKIKYLDSFSCSYIYSGEKIKQGYKAVTFKVAFTDHENTLEGHQVDESIELIIKNAQKNGLEFRNE
jgi:phenylalanyl-tRNA synthetase beta chain